MDRLHIKDISENRMLLSNGVLPKKQNPEHIQTNQKPGQSAPIKPFLKWPGGQEMAYRMHQIPYCYKSLKEANGSATSSRYIRESLCRTSIRKTLWTPL